MNNVKICFQLDSKGNPISSKPYITKEANHMIEEFMLLANMRVAEKIANSFPDSSLLRKHEDPQPRKLQGVNTFCQDVGLEIHTESAQSLVSTLLIEY